MKQENGYWVDADNNRWNESRFTEEEAERLSKTLRHCKVCTDCTDCSSCAGCQDFKDNPERVVSPRLGSREGTTTLYFNKDMTQVVCGCFLGSLEEFEIAVENKHGNSKYGIDYKNWISRVKKYMEAQL